MLVMEFTSAASVAIVAFLFHNENQNQLYFAKYMYNYAEILPFKIFIIFMVLLSAL